MHSGSGCHRDKTLGTSSPRAQGAVYAAKQSFGKKIVKRTLEGKWEAHLEVQTFSQVFIPLSSFLHSRNLS